MGIDLPPYFGPRCVNAIQAESGGGYAHRVFDARRVYLWLWEDKTAVERAPPVSIPEKNSEPYDDGWPQYEEPSITIH